MTKQERDDTIEILELAHGYALLGSLMPFREACIELDKRGSKAALLAGFAVTKIMVRRGIEGKPKREDYVLIMAEAIDYVTTNAGPLVAQAEK